MYKKNRKPVHKYTDEQVQFLKDNIKGTSYVDMVELFNNQFGTDLNVNQISGILARLNLRNGLDGKFKPGQVPYTKGMTWDEYMPKESQEKCRKTLFKKGQVAINTRPVGSERLAIRERDYILVKSENGEWIGKHIAIWNEHNPDDPYVKGRDVIVFLDGNKENFDINNLFKLTHKEHLVFNSHYKREAIPEANETKYLLNRIHLKNLELKQKKRGN